MAEIRIVHLPTGVSRSVAAVAPTMPGWNQHVRGFRIAAPGSGAPIELDVPLDGVTIGIFAASNHRILWGRVDAGATAPPIALVRGAARPQPPADDGAIYVRFDGAPVRIGDFELCWID